VDGQFGTHTLARRRYRVTTPVRLRALKPLTSDPTSILGDRYGKIAGTCAT